MSDYQAAGITVGHNMYVLRTIVLDLAAGFRRDANERRFISAAKPEIAEAIANLQQILEQIERADTSQTVSPIRLAELPAVVRLDPRDPDPSREGMFRYHNCWRCRHGKLPCAQGNVHTCSNPHARDD